MIYEFIRQRLEMDEKLRDKVFPTGVCLDEVELPIAVYTEKETTPVTDLSGEVHHYKTQYTVDLLGEDFDELHGLYLQAAKDLKVSNLDTGNGEYIFSSGAYAPEPDAWDQNFNLLRRSMKVDIAWCELEEDDDEADG